MSEDQESVARKKRLLDQLSEAEGNAAEVVRTGQEIVESGQYIRDMAAAERRFVEEIPGDQFVESERWEAQISTWSGVNSLITSQQDALSSDMGLPFIADYTTAATSGFVSLRTLSLPPPDQVSESLNAAAEQHSSVLHQLRWSDRVEAELGRFGLDVPSGDHRIPLAQIRSAEQAYRRLAGDEPNPAAVLIPAREAVKTVLAELLRRRFEQEGAKSWDKKVMSIGKQAAFPEVTEEQLRKLSIELCRLIDDLSSGKQHNFSRSELQTLLDRSISFLTALLGALDHRRMRS